LQYNEVNVVEFLTTLFKNGNSYSAINTARSALSCIMIDKNGVSIGNSNVVKRFLKGIFELRPPSARYAYIWDVSVVIEFLKNYPVEHDLPLSIITYKLVMLMALATKQRAQTLHAILIDQIQWYNKLVIIPIRQNLKQSSQRKRKFALYLKPYTDKCICVVETLRLYLQKTHELRKDYKQLFISFHKPFKPVSKDTISRWIKTVMLEAGIDTAVFKAHSTRSAAASADKRDNVPIDSILKNAGWSNVKTFEKFYDKVIMDV